MKLDKPKPEYRRQYEILVEGMAQGVFSQIADGTLVDVNPAALEMFGLDRDQFFGRTSYDPGWKVVSQEGTDLLPEQHPSMVALRTGRPVSDTVVGVYNPSKKSFAWLIVNAIPVIREGEQTAFMVFVTLQDITKRKRLEEELIKNQQLLTEMGKTSKVGGWEFNIDTESLQWTEEVYRIHEVGLDYVPTVESALDFYSNASKPVILEAFQRAIEHDEPFDLELEMITAKDTLRHVHAIGMSDLEYRRVHGIFQDITERKNAENGLLKSNKRFQDITAQSPLPMVITDAKGDIEFFNNKFIEVFGYTLDDISTAEQWWLAAYPNNVYRQEVQESWTKAIDKALEKGTQIETQEWEITCKNGAVRCVEFDMMPLGDISVIVMNDITERKKADALIKESNEELDAFVHTVAHDLRNPLTPIMGYAEILRENYKEQLNEEGLSYLAEIEKAGTGMLDLMEGLLSLAKSGTIKRPIKFVPTDKVVARVIKNLAPNISAAGATLLINPLPPIHIPKTFLAQIFNNLIGNALRYAGNSGDLIEVGGEQAGKQIRFFVRDHGPGISEQERKHIFEIFYRGTNKGKVKGSGIGLAIVYKIARNYGGRAWVEETPGGGCTFWVEVEDVDQA